MVPNKILIHMIEAECECYITQPQMNAYVSFAVELNNAILYSF